MTKQQIAAKLRQAVALMNDEGKHWIKGEYSEPLDYDDDDNPVEYGFCSLGAIRFVTGIDVEDTSEESTEVARALAEVLPPEKIPVYAGVTEEGMVFDRIVFWNDADEREWSQVVEAFNTAAARLEQS